MSHYLAPEQDRSFEENGYLAIDGLLVEADLALLEQEYSQLLDRLATDLYVGGIISSQFEAFWPQDTVALTPDTDETRMLTIWVAMTEATVENGCLMSIPGSHKGGTVRHCPGKRIAAEMYVPDVLIGGRKSQPLPLAKGGVILFDKHNIHRALPNRSNGLRWSFDLRYSVTGEPTGRPAFPGFVARSRANPENELRDPVAWKKSWAKAREAILSGAYVGPVFEQKKWEDESDMAICA